MKKENSQMSMQSSIHPYFNWAKERLDEMDATLASLEDKVGEVRADARAKADNILADLRKKRDDFQVVVKKQSDANEAARASAKAQLESDWNAFEVEVKKYVESFGKQIEQQKATFALQSAAQLKAWHEAADKFAGAAKEFAAERRGEIDTVVKQMKTDAATAEETLQKLTQAGNQSWTALTAALNETRAAFDRADQAAREAFKKATAA
jgi:hypothetical protein